MFPSRASPYLDSVPQCVHACEWLIGRVGRMIPTFVLFCSNKETTPTFFHRIIRLMLDNFPQFFYWIQLREGAQICFLEGLVLNVLCEIKMHEEFFEYLWINKPHLITKFQIKQDLNINKLYIKVAFSRLSKLSYDQFNCMNLALWPAFFPHLCTV